MPHAIVKLRPGKSEQQKQQLADAIARDVMTVLQYGEESVSVAFEEVTPENWTEQVYQPDIQAKWNKVYKKPGYEPFWRLLNHTNGKDMIMIASTGYGATSAREPLSKLDFQRRDPHPDDVQIDILYCGVCHSDLHTARNEWGNTIYPVVPGHEIIGRVTAVGSEVTRFKEGDLVGVGCMVDSCQRCGACAEGLEQYCENGFVGTYNGEEMHSGGMTYGGYSSNIVVRDKFVLRIPENLDPAGAAPLLCAGITTYSPLRQWQVGPGQKVGIVGLGGLGHMGIKLAHAMGAHVVLFTTSPGKREDAKRLGADDVVVSKNADEMQVHRNSFDFILNTVAAPHALDPFIELLKRDGTMTLVGAPASPHPAPQVFNLIFARRRLAGSLIGGIAETQEMLDFCGERGIVSDIEMIRIQDINTAYERMLKSDVKYRFVIDMASLKQEA